MIRQLNSADSSSYLKIRLEGLTNHPEAFGSGAEDWSKVSEEQVRDFLEKCNHDDFILGAFCNNVLIGVIGYKREKKHSVRHKGTVWGHFVQQAFRRKGFGKALLEKLIERVSDHDEIEYIRALITVSSLQANHVFEACGFSTFGLEQNGIKEGLNFYDQAYYMFKLRK